MIRRSFIARGAGYVLVILACPGYAASQQNSSNAASIASSTQSTWMVRAPSKDGTVIAAECSGRGPTLLIVHGGSGDRTRWTPMFPLLASHLTVCAMDRRGRGASGDSPEYSLQKEAEDVAAVVDSQTGAVSVLGHSYGGVSALEAAFLTKRISKLLLYEPPVQDPIDHNLAVAGRIETMIKNGQRDSAAVTFLSEVVQLTSAEVAAMRLRPSWAGLVANVGSQPRQLRALATYRFDAARIRTLSIPTLLLIGGKTASPYAKTGISSLHASLPNSTVVVLEGQEHNAMDSARGMLADAILNFVMGGADSRR